MKAKPKSWITYNSDWMNYVKNLLVVDISSCSKK